MKLEFRDIGNMPYGEAWEYQQQLLDSLVAERTAPLKTFNDDFAGWLLFVEHPHVYTLGKSGSEDNLLINYMQLQAQNATFFKTNRGGDITYHGPGQIVGYPVLDLEKAGLGVRRYVELLEESVIKTIGLWGLKGERLDGATGVWLDANIPGKARKICAIGVRVSRSICMHGFAFNVNTDLSYFRHINPCGFVDKGVTSLELELGKTQDIGKVKGILVENIYNTFGFVSV